MSLIEFDHYLSGHHRGGHAVAQRALVGDWRDASGSAVTWTRWTAVVERRTLVPYVRSGRGRVRTLEGD